jgi:hypothetical protein
MSLIELSRVIIMNLPVILRLLNSLIKIAEESGRKDQIKKDLSEFANAIEAKDAEAINRIINS